METPHKEKYPKQRVYQFSVAGLYQFTIAVNSYAYLVPFEQQGDKITLKTIYPSRKLTKRFQVILQGG